MRTPPTSGWPRAPSWPSASRGARACACWASTDRSGRRFTWRPLTAGGASAGIYTTCSASEVGYILEHAEAKVVLLEDEAQWDKVAEVRGDLTSLEHVVMMRDAPDIDDPMVLSWEAFIERGQETPDEALSDRMAALAPSDLASLIYTSGTTGPPKGVMLSHDNVLWTANCVLGLASLTPQDSLLSYLPLSHIAEQMFTVYAPRGVRECGALCRVDRGGSGEPQGDAADGVLWGAQGSGRRCTR